ncbi:MAG: hypothetical protein LBU84_12605 [Prevotella sp.]|jgi:hypothetical protein|nr:hypothetical protein [Prevotella sp.]
MKKYISICLFILYTTVGYAQSVWQGDLQSVDTSGYYNIELDQYAIAHSKDIELTDIRVLDKDNKEVPYFLRSVSPVQEIARFKSYDLKNNSIRDSLNVIVVDNNKKENIKRFYIVVKAADVNKYATVRGSDDLKNWYIVKQKTGISNLSYNQSDSEEILVLDFPSGNYTYYEITLESNQGSPLDIIKVGKIENSSIYAQFTKIDLGRFISEEKEDKKTYLRFPEQQEVYRVNKLEFKVNSSAYYLRHVSVIDTISGKRIGFDLSSKSDNSFFVNNFPLGKHTVITIENNNNPPLTIDSIRVYGLNRYLCAYLEQGKEYCINIGVKNMALPKYDIHHFQADIPVDLPILKVSNLHGIPDEEVITPKRELSLIERPVFLWGVIIVIGLFLTFICVKMLKEMKKKK